MSIEHIATLAMRVRRAIEGVPPAERPIGLQRFPHGACGDASLLLGAYLSDNGYPEFQYICGERGRAAANTWTTHAWLQMGDLVVDITADQFADSPSHIVVASPSHWHSSFKRGDPSPADFRVWSGYGADILVHMYARMQPWLSNAAS